MFPSCSGHFVANGIFYNPLFYFIIKFVALLISPGRRGLPPTKLDLFPHPAQCQHSPVKHLLERNAISFLVLYLSTKFSGLASINFSAQQLALCRVKIDDGLLLFYPSFVIRVLKHLNCSVGVSLLFYYRLLLANPTTSYISSLSTNPTPFSLSPCAKPRYPLLPYYLGDPSSTFLSLSFFAPADESTVSALVNRSRMPGLKMKSARFNNRSTTTNHGHVYLTTKFTTLSSAAMEEN